MIFLENSKDGGSRIYFLVGVEYTVGRKDSSILISGDQSISRKHAVLRVVHAEVNLNDLSKPASLEVTDSSKFGTIVNGAMISNGQTMTLNHGDALSFGAQGTNLWRVRHDPLVVACSGISGAEKKELKILIHKLGGHLLSDWLKECSFLVMKQLNVTAKVVGALVSCRSIVTPEFLKQMKQAVIEKKGTMPDPTGFLPPIVEKVIGQDTSVFTINNKRKTLLQGKMFIFLSLKQYKRLHTGVELAGATTIVIREDKDIMNNKKLVLHPQTCVMQSEAADNTQVPRENLMKIEKLLKSNGLRMIDESELGLAVLYVSTKLYCNPTVSQAGVTLISSAKDSQLASTSNQQVLATETQAQQSQPPDVSHDRESKRNEIPILGRVPSLLDQSTDFHAASHIPSEVVVKKDFKSPPIPDNISKKEQENISRVSKTEKEPTKSALNRNENDESVVSDNKQSEFTSIAESTAEWRQTTDVGKRKRVSSSLQSAVSSSSLDLDYLGDSRTKKIKTEPELEEEMRAKTFGDLPSLSEGDFERNDRDDIRSNNVVANIKAEPEEWSSQTQDQTDVEGDSQIWRKNKKKRHHIIQEEIGEGHRAASHDPSPDVSMQPSASEPQLTTQYVPFGFLCKAKPPKGALKQEPSDPDLPSKLLVVREVSVVVKRPKVRTPTEVHTVNGKPLKNFKKFRKVGYAGQSELPRIIGGSDLITHHNLPSQESQDLFMPDIQSNSDVNKADALADELFSMGTKQKTLPKGRRR